MGFLVSARQKSVLGVFSLCTGVLIFGLIQVVEGGLLFFRYAEGHHPSALRRASVWVAIANLADGITAAYTAWRPSRTMALCTAVGFLLDGVLHLLMFILRFEVLAGQQGVMSVMFLSRLVVHMLGFALLIYMVRSSFTLYQVLRLGGTGHDFMSPTQLAQAGHFEDAKEAFRRDDTLDERRRIVEARPTEDDYTRTEPVYI